MTSTAGIATRNEEYTYGKFQKDSITTFIPAIGQELIQPDLVNDIFEGNTYKPEELEYKYGNFEGFIKVSELPDLRLHDVIIDKWSILQIAPLGSTQRKNKRK